jgi:hypothetical protein
MAVYSEPTLALRTLPLVKRELTTLLNTETNPLLWDC